MGALRRFLVHFSCHFSLLSSESNGFVSGGWNDVWTSSTAAWTWDAPQGQILSKSMGGSARRGGPWGGAQGGAPLPFMSSLSAPLNQLLLGRLRQAARPCQEWAAWWHTSSGSASPQAFPHRQERKPGPDEWIHDPAQSGQLEKKKNVQTRWKTRRFFFWGGGWMQNESWLFCRARAWGGAQS